MVRTHGGKTTEEMPTICRSKEERMRLGALKAMIMGCLISSSALGGQVSGIEYYYQLTGNWCWAATSQIVRKANQNIFRWQCKMASALTANSTDALYCCNGNADGLNASRSAAQCNVGFYVSKALFWNTVHDEMIGTAATDARVRQEIDLGWPLVTRIGWDSGGGHFLVLYGYSGSNYSIFDPIAGAKTLSRDALIRYQNRGNWDQTDTTFKENRHGNFDAGEKLEKLAAGF